MGTIDELGVNTVELTHALSKVTFRRLHHRMVMIAHLTIRVAALVEAFAHLAEQVQPGFAVGIGKIDILAPVTARSDVV